MATAVQGSSTSGDAPGDEEHDDQEPDHRGEENQSQRGLTLGGAGGLLAGLVALAFPPAGVVVGGGGVLLVTLFGAGLGAFMSALAGASFSSSRLREFEEAVEAGKLLVMADVPSGQVERYEALIRQADPEVEVLGVEPHAPLIPKD